MLDVKELKGLSCLEVENKVKPISAKLVPMLVDRGILKANKGVLFKSGSMYNLDLEYSVMGGSLNCECEGATSKEYVVAITEDGFNVVSLNGSSAFYGELKILSQDTEKVVYVGDFGCVEDIEC